MSSETQTQNYIDKQALYDEIVKWQDETAAAVEVGQEAPPMPESVGRAIIDMSYGLSTRYNFREYSWVDEMIGDGIEAAIKAVPKFDRNHPKKNPFGFLNFIIWRAFVNRITVENNFIEFKTELMLDETVEAYNRGELDSDAQISKASMIETYTLND